MTFFDNWLLVGLLAALFFGSSAVLSKIVLSQKFFGVDPKVAGMLLAVGVSVVLIGFFLFSEKTVIPSNPIFLAAGIGVGILWGIGQILVLTALSRNANISQLAPVYNINTLVAVVLGIFLLAEIPSASQAVKVGVGAVLITIGAVLVSG